MLSWIPYLRSQQTNTNAPAAWALERTHFQAHPGNWENSVPWGFRTEIPAPCPPYSVPAMDLASPSQAWNLRLSAAFFCLPTGEIYLLLKLV